MERDHALEGELLEQANVPDGFADQVLARLAHYEAKHGNSGWEQSVDALLAEMQEEAADIAGWGIGAGYKLTAGQRCRLVVAIALGAAAWRELQDLREQLAVDHG